MTTSGPFSELFCVDFVMLRKPLGLLLGYARLRGALFG